MSADGVEWEELTRERVRAQLLDTAAMSAWKGLPPGHSKADSDAAAARTFRALDADGSGLLGVREAEALLSSLAVHPTVRRAVRDVLARHAGGVSFPVFLRSVWNLGAQHDDARDAPPLQALLAMRGSPRDQARAVFDSIDLDRSGVLERFELAELLVQWGCPEEEVSDYLRRLDGDGSGQIDFETEFFPRMAPIWQFGFDTVLIPRARDAAKRGWTMREAGAAPAGAPAASGGSLEQGAERSPARGRARTKKAA
jgi:Ca2+-binding EF-hand superfamily protein